MEEQPGHYIDQSQEHFTAVSPVQLHHNNNRWTPVLSWITHHYPIVVLVIASIILLESIWGIQVIKSTQRQLVTRPNPQATPQLTTNVPRFTLISSTNQAKVGQPVTATVMLNTAGKSTDGATAVVTYDPKLLRVDKTTYGQLYKNTVKATINDKDGTIRLTGFSDIDKSTNFSGEGMFATITFIPKAKGTTKLGFETNPKTPDKSAIAGGGKQLLEQTLNTSITIQ